MGGGMNELGNKIKLWRNYRHLTLEQLNALTGIHYARLSKFERGVEIPNQQMLERIEIALDVKFDDLKIVDEEIEALIFDFIDTLFYMRMNFDYFIDIINEKREVYMINQNYYKINLIEYIISVLKSEIEVSNKLEKTLNSTVEPNTLYQQLYLEYKAVKMHSLRHFNEAFVYAEKALSISNYNKNTAMINFHYSLLHHDCGQYEDARKYLMQAKQMFLDGCSYKRAINCDIQMADIYTRIGCYKKAIELQIACLEVFHYMEVNDSMRALTLRNTAWVHILMTEYEKSLKILDEAEILEPKNGNLILYKIWCYYSLGRYDDARKIIDDNQYLHDVSIYKDRFKLFEYLVINGNQKPSKKLINKAKEVYENLAEKEVYENMYFYLDILIDLLDRANDKDELIHYLKIKGHLGK